MPSLKVVATLLLFILIFFSQAGCQDRKPSTNITSCEVAKSHQLLSDVNIQDTLGKIIRRSPDSCNLLLVDAFVNNFIKSPSKQFYKSIDKLASLSDGYLSEYFTEKVGDIFLHRFPPFFSYLYNEHTLSGETSRLSIFLVDYWSDLVSRPGFSDKGVDYIKEQAKTGIIPTDREFIEKLKYLNSLIAKIDPEYRN